MLNGFGKSVFEFISNISLSGLIQSLLTIGTVVFLYFKIRNSGLDIKIKSNLLRKEKREKKHKQEQPEQRLFKLTKKKNKLK